MSDQRLLMWAVVGLVAGGISAGLWLLDSRPETPAPAPSDSGTVAAADAAVPASTPTATAAPAASTPVPDAEVPATAAPPFLAAADIAAALTELIGSKAVQTFLQTDDFPRRLVATVDNLGRGHAAPMLWPVNPTEGRFTVEEASDGTRVSAENSRRYTPFVLLVETVDIDRTVALYRRMEPLMQQAYVDLGYPGRSFNARLIEVIDLLLTTPDAPEPLMVRLTEVKGSIPSTRPWVRYEFDDPALEALAAGQKILIRTGPVNQRRLKAKLAEIRRALVAIEGRR